jgi:drug/metabolite transporter (DMT)-like permease
LTGMVTLFGGHSEGFQPSREAILVLLYLGAVPSALGFFFWNWGARKAQPGVLAVANNIKIPLAVAISLVVFREPVSWIRFVPGTAMLVFCLWYALGCNFPVSLTICTRDKVATNDLGFTKIKRKDKGSR